METIQELDESWKFIQSDYIFPDPTDPFIEPIPDQRSVNLQEDISGLDFIAVKIGDPNNSANPRRLDGFDENTTPLFLDRDINQDIPGELKLMVSTP